MLYNLQIFAKFQKFQLDNLVDFEKCCKMHIYLQKSAPIQPKTNEFLPNICQKFPGNPLLTGADTGDGRRADTGADAASDDASDTGSDRISLS